MKVSEWLRQYQITGEVPDVPGDDYLPFWAGWLIGHSSKIQGTMEQHIETAIKAAEFIEERAK